MVPFHDLRRRVAAHRPLLDRAFSRVMDSGRFILGESVAELESRFSGAVGRKHGIGVASGTDALKLALEGLGIGPGDEVVTTANTCAPTVTAILECGATPVLADVDEQTLTLDPKSAAAALTPKTRCILPVHLYGQCADMGPILELAKSRGLIIVEDCAQAHGASYRGRPAGSFGDAAAFSFYPTKNLGALGDGGMVVTDDAVLAEKVRLLRQYGYREPNHSVIKGHNSRLDELQAAFLLELLPGLPAANDRRRAIAAAYSLGFAGQELHLPAERPEGKGVFHLYVIRVRNREAFRSRLQDRGVETVIHYPVPIHRQEGLQGHCKVAPGGLPITEKAADEISSLPMFPELADSEVSQVIEAVLDSREPRRPE